MSITLFLQFHSICYVLYADILILPVVISICCLKPCSEWIEELFWTKQEAWLEVFASHRVLQKTFRLANSISRLRKESEENKTRKEI